MNGRVFHAVSLLLAAGCMLSGVCLMTGCTDGTAPEPDASSLQTEPAQQSDLPAETAADVTGTAAVKKQSADPGEPPEFRVPVPEADLVIEPEQPEQPEQPKQPKQPGQPAQPEQPDDPFADPEPKTVTGPWIEIDY